MPDDLTRIVVGAVLLLHGLGHGGALVALLWFRARPGTGTGPWRTARSWLLPALSHGAATLVASTFLAVALIGFVVAALSFWDLAVPGDVWRPVAVIAATASMAGIVLFLGTWPAFNTTAALAVNVAVLVAVLWLGWPADASETRVIHFVPERPAASTAVEGSCFATSLAAAGREDAWRCAVGNDLHDPCFSLDADTVVCGGDPVRGATGFLLTLVEPLPAPEVPPSAVEAAKVNGWLVELEDGTICNFATGATGGVDGKRANYACADRRWILGDLVPGEPWTADLATISVGPEGWQADTRATVALATVWQ